jgi:hypothetical protein
LIAVAANFFTMASSSLRSLSFKFEEYRRIWVRKRSSSSVRVWVWNWCPRVSSMKNCEMGISSAMAIFDSVSREGTVWPFSTRER